MGREMFWNRNVTLTSRVWLVRVMLRRRGESSTAVRLPSTKEAFEARKEVG